MAKTIEEIESEILEKSKIVSDHINELSPAHKKIFERIFNSVSNRDNLIASNDVNVLSRHVNFLDNILKMLEKQNKTSEPKSVTFPVFGNRDT